MNDFPYNLLDCDVSKLSVEDQRVLSELSESPIPKLTDLEIKELINEKETELEELLGKMKEQCRLIDEKKEKHEDYEGEDQNLKALNPLLEKYLKALQYLQMEDEARSIVKSLNH
jgi:hypothetical protein